MLLETRLQKMKGKTFMYKMVTRKILDYKLTEDELFISTDSNLVSIKLDKAESELDQFLPADGKSPTGLVKFAEDPKWAQLKVVAYDMVDKLNGNEGAKFIDQANAINQSIHSIVDLMKTEIEAVKLTQRG